MLIFMATPRILLACFAGSEAKSQLVEVVVAPLVMIVPPAPTTATRTLAQNRPQPAPDIAVHFWERGAVAVLEVSEPPAQDFIEPRNGNHGQSSRCACGRERAISKIHVERGESPHRIKGG